MKPDCLQTTCGYCSTGCNFTISQGETNEPRIAPTPDHPVNRGTSCPKGFLLLEPLKAADRGTRPHIRDSRGDMIPVDWGTTIGAFNDNFKRIQAKYGPESVAFISTGQMPTEEMALLGALTKFGMGVVHGDGNTRQCMATAAAAYKAVFGFDAPPFTYQDLAETDLAVFIGANPVICHPIIWNHLKRSQRNPKVVVIDPRRTETAAKADLHIPIRPDGLLSLLYCLSQILIARQWTDPDFVTGHTVGYEDFARHVSQFTPALVAGQCGVAEKVLVSLAELIAQNKRVSFWWTMGVNQNHQGVGCARAIINLALLTGNIGQPGTGANSITGQANAMGSRIFSNTTNLFGGRDFSNPIHRQEVAEILKIDEALIPQTSGWAYDQILAGVADGVIKGLWVICTNPAHSWIGVKWLHRQLAKLDYLVVQDMYMTTETAQMADLYLAAAGCGEKEGSFINSERRLGVVRQVSPPPGEALPDFEIFHKVAKAWGCDGLFEKWRTPQDVFELLKKLSIGRPCDFSGIRDYEHIQRAGGIQWPYSQGQSLDNNHRRLFKDSTFYHGDGKARFGFTPLTPPPEKTNADYPFVLLTGRGSVAQWHTQTRTGKVEKLRALYPNSPYVDINRQDAAALFISSGDMVEVTSRRASVTVQARPHDDIPPGQAFMAMHYPETNFLTCPHFDPISREPSYKYAAVQIKKK